MAMERANDLRERLQRVTSFTVRNERKPRGPLAEQMTANAEIDMGWGRILFGHTFDNQERLCAALDRETSGRRDIAFYLRDPHVLLAIGPDRLFLDPSHTYRLWLPEYQPRRERPGAFNVRRIQTIDDTEGINRLYAARQMVGCDPEFLLARTVSRKRTYLVAEC
jgi:hypothetical protein